MFDRNTANHDEHKELAKAIVATVAQHGLNQQHPAVQKAMEDMHEKIVNLMPNSSDADRGAAILKRGPLVAQNIKNALPVQHMAAGGNIVGDAVSGLIGAVGANSKPVQGGIADLAGKGVDTASTNESKSLNAPPSAADKNVASQNNPDARASNVGDKKEDKDDKPPLAKVLGGAGELFGEYQSMPGKLIGGDNAPATPNPGVATGTIDRSGGQPAPAAMPPAAVNAPPPPTGAGTPPASTPPMPEVGGDSTAPALPSAFTNSQTSAINESTPIVGMAAARQANLNRGQHYAATQTPEAMAAAQKDKGAVLAGQLAGSGQDSAGRNSALSSLANLGQDNLKAQQDYGNASLQEANKTGLDTQANQGAGIENANAASAQPRAGAMTVAQVQQKNTNDAVDFDQIQKALAAAGTLPSDVSQAIWQGESQQQILALSSLKNATPKQKTAIIALMTQLQKHPELKPPTGTIDPGAIKTMIDAQSAKNKNALDTARTQFGVSSGINETPTLNQNNVSPGVGQTLNQGQSPNVNPQGLADGGEVDQEVDQPDELDTDVGSDEGESSAPQDTLRKAFGFKPKASIIEDEQEAEQTAGPKTVTLADEKVTASTESPASPIGEGSEGAGPSTANTDIGSLIDKHATERGIDPRIAHAIAQAESGGNTNAVNTNRNGTSDYGVMQVNSSNLKPGEEKQAFDPDFNIGRGLDIYKEGLDRFNGNQPLALYAYNHGIRKAEQVGPGVAQRDPYVQRVMANLPQQ